MMSDETTHGTPVRPSVWPRQWLQSVDTVTGPNPDGTSTHVMTPPPPDPRWQRWLAETRADIMAALAIPADYLTGEQSEALDDALSDAYDKACCDVWPVHEQRERNKPPRGPDRIIRKL